MPTIEGECRPKGICEFSSDFVVISLKNDVIAVNSDRATELLRYDFTRLETEK